MSPIDRHVGSRLRLRRLELRLPRRELAAALRLTIDKIRRFEAGEERIGASRLWVVAETLGVPIHYFFTNSIPDPDDGDGDELEPEPSTLLKRISRDRLRPS